MNTNYTERETLVIVGRMGFVRIALVFLLYLALYLSLSSCSRSIGKLELKRVSGVYYISIPDSASQIQAIRISAVGVKGSCEIEVESLGIQMFEFPLTDDLKSRIVMNPKRCELDPKKDLRISVIGRKGDVYGYGGVRILAFFNLDESNWLFDKDSTLYSGLDVEYVRSTGDDWVLLRDDNKLIQSIDSVQVKTRDGIVLCNEMRKSERNSSYGFICQQEVKDYETLRVTMYGLVMNGKKSTEVLQFNVGKVSSSLRAGNFK